MLKWVIFDLGGVLIEHSFSPTANFISQRTGFSVAEVKARWFNSYRDSSGAFSLYGLYATGKVGVGEYLADLAKAIANGITVAELRESRLAELGATKAEVFEVLRTLKAQGQVKLACFSNTDELHWEALQRSYPFFAYLDVPVASHLIGAVKPEKNAYAILLERLGQPKPQECLIIDDAAENINAAQELGFQTILFRDFAKFQEELAQSLGDCR